jgi:type I restriction enzyme, R subunit
VDNDKDPCRASNGDDLRRLLGQHKSHIFTLIQKFNQRVDPTQGYTDRDDLIVITDEAHRTQYGTLALNMRNALPRASYIGFTGTPLFRDDEITRQVFGDYVSTYDFQRAVDDGATVPLYYDARGDKLGIATTKLNERIAEKLEQIESEDIDVQQRLERELKRDYHIITAKKRLDQVARDFVTHYSTAWETGKAMIVCIDKLTCVRVYNLIEKYWQEEILRVSKTLRICKDEQEEIYRLRQIEWMRETKMAVVVSEEQGEVDKFRKWELDITPHRRLIKEGYELSDGTRIDLESAYKKDEHPFRIAIVCAMWMTGFDVPSLGTLYLDKPLKAHTLMQAIARANRVNEGKTNGLVVDYCGILKNLRMALATFAGTGDDARGKDTPTDPTKPEKELLDELVEAITLVRDYLTARNASLDAITRATGFARNAAILAAKEAANENDETRKRFEIMCRAVFGKYKVCLTLSGINAYRASVDAIKIIYKSLQDDTEQADISDIIRQLHEEIDKAIETQKPPIAERANTTYDISKINFERLRQEFARSRAQRTTTQNLRQVVEKRLQKLLAQNPLRSEYQERYEEIIAAYNREKDRATIEATFEALLKFVQDLSEEETRAVREGLDEETLAIFDLLNKPDLQAAEIKRIKRVAVDLLATLKTEMTRIDHWRDRESTRDSLLVTIHNYLWRDDIGLPSPTFSETDVTEKIAAVFAHIYRAYPTLPSPYYSVAT